MPPCPHIIAILGPTASGKTTIAHRLAQRMNGEIVSCDSMQIYKDMEIGTAQPSVAEQREVPYHLIAEIKFTEPWNAHRHKIEAKKRIAAIHARGTPAFLVGGTGLYAKTILYDLPMHSADSDEYKDIFKIATTEDGRRQLIEEIRRNTPAFVIPQDLTTNPRRLARAVEILRIDGALPENFGLMTETKTLNPIPNSLQFILFPPHQGHRRHIHERTESMVKSGWIEETQKLQNHGFFDSATARQALGYKRILEFIQGHIPSHDRLIELIAADTWKYARRQRTWFRHQHPGAYQLTLRPGLSVNTICDTLATLINQS